MLVYHIHYFRYAEVAVVQQGRSLAQALVADELHRRLSGELLEAARELLGRDGCQLARVASSSNGTRSLFFMLVCQVLA